MAYHGLSIDAALHSSDGLLELPDLVIHSLRRLTDLAVPVQVFARVVDVSRKVAVRSNSGAR
jgi:hypothetical protein